MPKEEFPDLSGRRFTMEDKLNTTLSFIKSFQKKERLRALGSRDLQRP